MAAPLETLPRKLNAMRQALRASSHAARALKARTSGPPISAADAPRPVGAATVVSLFAGCGGMDLGFRGGFDFLGKHYERNPFDIIWANEINPEACKTYRLNLGEHIVEGDI